MNPQRSAGEDIPTQPVKNPATSRGRKNASAPSTPPESEQTTLPPQAPPPDPNLPLPAEAVDLDGTRATPVAYRDGIDQAGKTTSSPEVKNPTARFPQAISRPSLEK